MKLVVMLMLLSTSLQARSLMVGSKKFTESVILGEVLRLSFEAQELEAQHREELGGTRILWNALKSGDIDVYPEYTGTIEEEILRQKTSDLLEMRELLANQGIGMSAPLGFNNTYAVGMRRQRAQQLGITKVSQLRQHPELKIGWSAEFRSRQDGWPGLRERYQLPHQNVRGLDHDVAYRALEQGAVEVVDLYSTDAEIEYYDILVLEDDLMYFPRYEAVYLYRLAVGPQVSGMMERLAGRMDSANMIQLNRRAKIDRVSATEVAAKFLELELGQSVAFKVMTRQQRLLKRSLEHFRLVGVSLLLAILAAIPLGVVVSKCPAPGQVILMIVSAIQTIPALALLVMMIKPLSMIGLSGIGDTPAYIALFLYSLLPIVRNTYAGLAQIPVGLQETALVLGLSARTRLLKIELPLALPSILAGIKTSLVINIGFATLGALIGAGGYGQPILTGIRLDDYGLILEGALPAAVLALSAQKLFDLVERYLVSPGLKS
jgi:osmoprotectant transport system permease protein